MSDTTTTAPAPVQYGKFPIGAREFRVTTKVVKPRKTKTGQMTAEKKFVVFSPADLDEAKALFSSILDEVVKQNKDADAIQKFVDDVLSERCEDATNATLVKQADGSFAKNPANYVPELVNVARATRSGGEKIKDVKERLSAIMADSLELLEFRMKYNTDALIAANAPKDDAGRPKYTTLAQINTILATWTMERKALAAKVADHEHKLAERAENREKKAAEKKAEAPAGEAKA